MHNAVNTIIDQHLQLPKQAPVMVLPNALLFPSSLLPLYIFEPRYRAMLEWSLERERMFCIALLKPGLSDWSSMDDFHHVAGIGLLRACVEREDGTSHLVLQGLARVALTAFPQEKPFVIAELRPLPSPAPDEEKAGALSELVLGLCAEYRAKGAGIPEALDQQLARVRDAGVLSDIVAHTFVRDPHRRQSVLEATDIVDRLRMLIRHLREEMP
jgi:Lon protease-like protein